MKKCLIIVSFVLAMIFPLKVQAHESVELSKEEKILLQQVALAEARSEGIGGMAFVMQVLLNRVQDENFPNTLEEVVAEEGQFDTYRSGAYLKCKPNENSKKALDLLDLLVNRGQLYFENANGKEDTWHSQNLEYLFEYNKHTFYK